jgi:hypothetical protein
VIPGVRSAVGLTTCAIVTLAIAACGGGASSTVAAGQSASSHIATASRHRVRPRRDPPKPSYPPYPSLLGAATSTLPTPFVPAVRWRGQTAVWIARSQSGIGLLSFNQQLIGLRLHSGTIDAGSTGWRLGPEVRGLERERLVAAFNGAFKLATGAGGFESYGRVAAPLQTGLGSIVTYTDGYTDIGSWRHEVPAPGRTIASVRQNLTLLIDHGAAASSVGCDSCWGATLGGVNDPARSALGITADGRLVWAGGEHLTVAALADALRGARVVRAVELDINPEWVAGYLYGHRGGVGPLAPVPIAPGQVGVPGTFLNPYSRDFFTVVGR